MNQNKVRLGDAWSSMMTVIVSLSDALVECALALKGGAKTVRNYADWAEAESGQFKDEAEQERAAKLAATLKALPASKKKA